MSSDALGVSRTSPAFESAVFASSDFIARPIARPQVPAPEPIEVFSAQCEARALLFANWQLSLHEAIDKLQSDAERNGLIKAIGQDTVQSIMAIAFAGVRQLPDGDELNEACEREIMLREAELVRRWEAADPRDNGSGAPSPPYRKPEPYRLAESSAAAFRYVISLNHPDYLARWLAHHPSDAPALFKRWKVSAHPTNRL